MTTAVVLTDWTVYFNDNPVVDGGSHQIRWTGTTGTTDLQDLVSAIQDLWDNVTGGQGDYVEFGVPFRSITPTDKEIGQIFPNEPDSWFIDPESIKHLTGAGLRTTGWTYETGVRKGIFRVPMSSLGTIVASDVGRSVSNGTVDGVLLYVDTNNDDLYIRPTTDTAGDDWSSVSSGTINVTGNSNSGTQGAAGLTGENIWTNIFTLGTIFDDPQLYVYQDQGLIDNSEDSGSGLWWGTGQLDILLLTTQEDSLIDRGFVTVYARKVNTLYDNFISDVSAGGRAPIPLATGDDLNNQTAGVIAPNGIVLGFAGPYVADVDDDSVNENYSIQVNCANNDLSYVYEYLKYITREGETTLLGGLSGDQYQGVDYKLDYTGSTGTINVGDEITADLSDDTAYVISNNTTDNYVMVGNTVGNIPTQVAQDWTGPTGTLTNVGVDIQFSPIKPAPFGTFAGGRFFGAPGVLLTNVPGADLNNYEVIDDLNNVRTEPIQVTFTLTGILTDSEIRIYNDDLTNTRNTEITGTENSESTLRSINIIGGGTGYSVNDTLTLVGGTFTTAATLNVDAVSGGVITAVSISSPGEGYVEDPTAPISVTGGTGTGATFSGTFRGDFSYTYTYSTDINITIVVFNLFARDVRLLGLQLTDENQSIPIQQIGDRNYLVGSIP